MHGGDIYSHKIKLDFSININPLGIPLKAKIAFLRSLKNLQYYPDLSCRKLSQALCKKLKISESQLVFGNGACELIHAVLQAEKPGRLLLFAPCFTGYERAVQSCGARTLYFNLEEENDFEFSEHDLIRLKELFDSQKPDFVILTNPNNPNGRLYNKKIVEKIIHLCINSDAKLLVDETFIELTEDENQIIQPDYLIKAFTKTYAVPGLRLGYCICKNKVLADSLKKTLPEWNVSSSAQETGISLLKVSSRYLKKTRKLIRRENRYLTLKLKALGFKVYNSDTNFILFREQDINSASSSIMLFYQLLKKGILIRDCSDIKGLDQGFFRIAVKKHSQNRRLIKAIEKVRK